jgi:muramoyltetrapeptide carboxypeptidase
VGVAALSGWVEEERLDRGLRALRELGFRPVVAPNVSSRDGVFAGTDRQRLDGFHDLVADPDVRAIFFVRGGHGVLRLIDRIDWDLLARHPRAYVGYSDLTPLLLEILRRTGQVTFHGPMVGVEMARGLTPAELRSMTAVLEGRSGIEYDLEGPSGGDIVEGRLIGGCLSMLSSVSGTGFGLDTDGATVLFWEDIDEPYYRVDRMLTQLRLSGAVSSLAGMVIGRTGLDREDLERLGVEADVSFAAGLSSGHCEPNLTLPLGAPVRLDPRRGRLAIERS